MESLVAPDRMHPDSVYNKIMLLPQQSSETDITETHLVKNINVPTRSLRFLKSILEWFLADERNMLSWYALGVFFI